ncbi:MAG: hypothetical protein ACRDIC_19715 [bacterium]
MTLIESITGKIAEVCPIDGVSMGSRLDKNTWKPALRPEATPAQTAEAARVIEEFDIDEATADEEVADAARENLTQEVLADPILTVHANLSAAEVNASLDEMFTSFPPQMRSVLKFLVRDALSRLLSG